MTDTQTTPANDDALDKARALLRPLSPDVREQIISRLNLSDEQREALTREQLVGTRRGRTVEEEMAERRRLMRETALRMQQRNVEQVREATQDPRSDEPGFQFARDPLEQLRNVHPAALATAMQGERAETWALVMKYLDAPATTALMSYLDPPARRAIEAAQLHQDTLEPQLVDVIRRAIRHVLVPRALLEHQRLLCTPPPRSPASLT